MLDHPCILEERFTLATQDECYQALMAHMRAGCPNSRRYSFSWFSGERWILERGTGTFVSAADQTLDNYMRIVILTNEGWIVNGFQAWHPAISARVAQWIEKVVPLGVKAIVLVDAFFGRYRSSFFKLHKDEMDIYAFPIFGQKTYLCWPYERYAHLGGSPTDPCHPEHQEPYDRASAIRLTPQLGQVAFWPASYWHIAETDGASPTFSINIGVKRL